MLQIKNINKTYVTGALTQRALDGVSLNFRDNEFVAVLGPSGSGKTTLLNIVGGLDRYDDGDIIINGVSTKKYKDRDWDSYRNHTIGFVFQSYNLIPHQSILANVELALTISGISGSERRKRAINALEEVGLGDQLHKKPNQMSGGQMQRVAIARALVNDPDILLADEPTGALDSTTGVQVMDLLKKVAQDRLVIMVTHNSELAEKYATRLIRLRDGKIISDSNAFEPGALGSEPIHKNMGTSKMSMLTSLSLSANNLQTKKGRTLLTAFAGSIGIIGIALILALSNGVNDYIADIQKETMTSYPITISAETFDLGSMMNSHNASVGSRMSGQGSTEDFEERSGVFADNAALEAGNMIRSNILENDLTAFKRYLDNPDSEIRQYLGENGVVYTYDVRFDVYSYDEDGKIINSNADVEDVTGSSGIAGFSAAPGANMRGGMASLFTGSPASSGAENFQELMPDVGGNAVSQVVTDSYDLVHGQWPEKRDEVVLVLNRKNAISTSALYQLGLITADEYREISDQIKDNSVVDEKSWDYQDICRHTFYLVPSCDSYSKNDDGTFTYIGDNSMYQKELVEKGIELKIVGIIRPREGAANANLTAAVGYTTALTEFVIEHTNKSNIVLAQEASPKTNVLNGMHFEALDDEAKIEDAKEFISGMNVSDKASLYALAMYYASEANADEGESGSSGQPSSGMPQGMIMSETAMASAMDRWLLRSPDEDFLLSIYDQYISGKSYESNMSDFGKVSYDAPYSISIYSDSFEDKDSIAASIESYNSTADEDSQISYTDYVALLTSSITSIVNVISYVLIAFVAVSLIVSCIMIGIITHISVLERTKEIGILRALGASKRNISQVFNAETLIIGLVAGLLGVGLSLLLMIPINVVIRALTDVATLSAQLPLGSALALTVLSMVITVIGGLIPSRNAAKKDPVIALRTE